MNKACLDKLWWTFMNDKNSLWCRIMKSKYASRYQNTNSFMAKTSDSCIWKSIIELRPKLDTMAYWEVGNDHSIRIWKDA